MDLYADLYDSWGKSAQKLPKPEDRVLVVVGSAPTVDVDLRFCRFLDPEGVHVMAVNEAIVFCPLHVHHFATLHHDDVPDRVARRRAAGSLNMDFRIHSRTLGQGVHHHWQVEPRGLTSGGWGMVVGLLGLGYTKVILAGVPLLNADGSKRWGREVYDRWDFVASKLGDRVRSFSGWTMELFGTPTGDWIDGTGEHPTHG